MARKRKLWEEARLLGQEANPDQDGWSEEQERWAIALRDGVGGVREELLERRRPIGVWSWRMPHSSRRHRRRHGDTTQVVTGESFNFCNLKFAGCNCNCARHFIVLARLQNIYACF